MTTCSRCGRALRTADSQARGMGPTCARRARQERAVEGVKADTLAKAREDVEDGAIVDTRRVTSAGRRVFAVASSDGTDVYLTTAGGACTCRWGMRGTGTPCRHAVAARLIAA